jgi:hypothetical protein
MTILTDIGRLDMLGMLPGSGSAIMTARAVSGNRRVVKIRRRPTIGRVTALAVISARDMQCMLACGSHTIMTATTGSDHICMVNTNNRCPGGVTVTILADVCRLYMLCMLTGCSGAVMTT